MPEAPVNVAHALCVYAEPLAARRRVVVVGDSSLGLDARLVALGARTVHVYDPDPARARANAHTAARGVVVRELPAGELDVREGAFDLAIVPDLAAIEDRAGLLVRVRRLVGAEGAALVAARSAPAGERRCRGRRLDYYEMYDLGRAPVRERADDWAGPLRGRRARGARGVGRRAGRDASIRSSSTRTTLPRSTSRSPPSATFGSSPTRSSSSPRRRVAAGTPRAATRRASVGPGPAEADVARAVLRAERCRGAARGAARARHASQRGRGAWRAGARPRRTSRRLSSSARTSSRRPRPAPAITTSAPSA